MTALRDQPTTSPRNRIISQSDRAYFPLDRLFSHQIIDFFGLFLAYLIIPA